MCNCVNRLSPQIGTLVSEKDLNLRLALRNMGMLDSSYWISWMMYDALITLVTALLLVIFGEQHLRLYSRHADSSLDEYFLVALFCLESSKHISINLHGNERL